MENNREEKLLKKNEKNDVIVKQINSPTPLNDLEKTTILEFTSLTKEELPKKKINLGDTIRLKLSDLREKMEEQLELPSKKKNLYDTVILKLDDLVNRKNALQHLEAKKVTSEEETNISKKYTMSIRKLPIPTSLSVTSDAFGKHLYTLNKMALSELSEGKETVRKQTPLAKLQHIEKITINKENYQKYEKDLNKFAINKLYYKFAPKETNKYKIYKYSFLLVGILFFASLFSVLSWCMEGNKTKEMHLSLLDNVLIEQVYSGEIIPKTTSINNSTAEQKDMYTRYMNTPLASVDFKPVLEINPDTIGWLIVPNTNVNYPVVQTKNNDYYLKHSFDKSNNPAGWVFADFRNQFSPFSTNTVIYAHGRKDKVMFGSLTDALNPNWYKQKENQIIQFSTLENNTMWQIFSIYTIKAESYYITTDFSSQETFTKFLETMKSRSIYDFQAPVSTEDKILTLSTCYNDQGERLVIQAKLVKIQNR